MPGDPCITLWEPWASLLVHGAKTIETRGWRTHHTGPLWIHAAKRWSADQREFVRGTSFFEMIAGESGARGTAKSGPHTLGKIVGSVVLDSCRLMQPSFDDRPCVVVGIDVSDDDLAYGHWEVGRYAWITSEQTPLDVPIPANGAQGIWRFRGA